jgi:hypothetical protein
MVTWLTRSLLFIIAGAILAFAVTAHHVTYHRSTLDVQTVGVVLLLVGAFDLLLNFGMLMYMRQPAPVVYPTARHASGPVTSVTRTTTSSYPVVDTPASNPAARNTAARNTEPTRETQVLRRDDPNWH